MGVDAVVEADVVIIGSGMGGAVMALGLAEQGIETLLVEQGTFLPREEENWIPEAVFGESRYKAREQWWDAHNATTFQPGVHYVVGGSTKVYGASLPRFREADFGALRHDGGTSPAWPFSYAELERWYGRAERVFGVHGTPGADPTEPPRTSAYPYPALEHEPAIAQLSQDLERIGLHPSPSATAVDLREGGSCIRCPTCDGFPCMMGAKGDAERCAIKPALATGHVHLLDNVRVDRLVTDRTGKRINHVTATHGGQQITLRARTFIVSAGAVNSAALLLASGSEAHPNGLANSSGKVGRNYMVHNATFLIAVDPRRRNHTQFQKTLMVNDWYLDGPDGFPLGNVQLLGKLRAAMLKPARPRIPNWALTYATEHSWDFYLESEDLPTSDNRVTLDARHRIAVHWQPNNMRAHRGLIKAWKGALREAGFPFSASQTMGIETNSHQCGTVVAGLDPTTSVLDTHCRSHDVENLFVVDGSYFPSSAAVNPALTIAAQALRVAYEGDVLR